MRPPPPACPHPPGRIYQEIGDTEFYDHLKCSRCGKRGGVVRLDTPRKKVRRDDDPTEMLVAMGQRCR